ncbi:Peripherin-2 [Sparganum proliferum]
MLKTYTALVIILFFVEIIIAILTSVESNRFTCCGANSALDYPINKIPDTCCSQLPCNTTNAFKRGCAKELSGYLEKQMLTMSITAFVSSSVALFSVGFACLFFRECVVGSLFCALVLILKPIWCHTDRPSAWF